MSDAERKKKQNERQRRSRAIKRKLKVEDKIPVTLEVSRETRDAFIDAGLLGAWDEENADVVQIVLQQHIDSLRYVTRDRTR